MLITINQFSEIIASCVGIYTFTRLDYFSKLIAVQVFIALIVELIGLQILKQKPSNVWLYNYYMLAEFSLLIIAAGLKSTIVSLKSIILLLLFFLCWGLEIYWNSIEIFAVNTYVLGATILLVSFSIVLYRSVQNRDPLFGQSKFWFAIGIILFYGCNIPFFAMHDYIKNYSNPAQINLLTFLMVIFVHIRYLCMAIGFLIVFREVKKKQKAIKYGE